MGMQRRSGVRGKRHMKCLAQCRHLQKPGNASATSRVRLQHINRSGRQHAAKVSQLISIFSGGDLHNGWSAITQESQASQIIGGYGLFKPIHAQVGKFLSLRQRLFPTVGSVGVHKQFCVRCDGFSGCAHSFQIQPRVTPDFHLHTRDAPIHPTFELLLQLFGGIRGKSAAAIDRH